MALFYIIILYFYPVANSFSGQIVYNKKPLLAVIVPTLKSDGMHYEVNIKGYPRFYMMWSMLDRFDITNNSPSVPYELVLLISDLLEEHK